MSRHLVTFFEDGDWHEHEVPRETVPAVMADLAEQCDDDLLPAYAARLTNRRMTRLVEVLRGEMHARERGVTRPQNTQDVINLYGE